MLGSTSSKPWHKDENERLTIIKLLVRCSHLTCNANVCILTMTFFVGLSSILSLFLLASATKSRTARECNTYYRTTLHVCIHTVACQFCVGERLKIVLTRWLLEAPNFPKWRLKTRRCYWSDVCVILLLLVDSPCSTTLATGRKHFTKCHARTAGVSTKLFCCVMCTLSTGCCRWHRPHLPYIERPPYRIFYRRAGPTNEV